MKRTSTLMNLTMLMAAMLMTASCMDDDTAESITLSGQWTGDFGMFYDYEYRGQVYTFNSYDTDIVFYPDYDYATHGYGYEVDFYNEGPKARMSFRFFWEINRGNIYLDYPGYPQYNTVIRDYSLSNYYFTGYFENGTEQFRLRKLADFYNWNDYSVYDYRYWDDPCWNWSYYAKTRGLAVDDDPSLYFDRAQYKLSAQGRLTQGKLSSGQAHSSLGSSTTDGRIIRMGHRLTDN